ncbi:MAG: TonB-dependent receptor [Bacteroidales bacterium]|nr:TonB-dependent receptor [Bacteroidales bacterium]
MKPLLFRRWSQKKYAVLATFHKVIHIGTLSLAYNLLQCQPVIAQQDTTAPVMFYHLEEVEAISENEADIQSIHLRQLTLIHYAQLERLSSRSLDEIIDDYPGIDIRTRGVKGIQSDISIRGGSFDQSLILLNGISMNNPQTGHLHLNLPLAPSMLHRVEILKGPGANTHGPGAYAGAINLVTRPSDSLQVSAEASFSEHNTWNGSVILHLPAGNSRTMVGASADRSDGYTENTDFDNKSIYLHSVAEYTGFRTELIVGANDKSFGANSFYTPKYPGQFEETSTWLSALKLEAGRSPLKVFGQWHWKRDYDHYLLSRKDPSLYENYHRTDAAGMTAGARLSSKLGLSALSVQIRHESILSTSLGDPVTTSVNIKRSGSNATYEYFKKRTLLSLSATHAVQFNRFFMNVGFLLQSPSGLRGTAGAYPGIDLSFSLNENTTLFTSLHRSMRLPTFTDLYYMGPVNQGNTDLLPEKSLTFEGGAKLLNRWMKAEAAIFYRNGSQSIDWIWNDTAWYTANLTNLNTFGGEVAVLIYPGTLLPSAGLIRQARISYSYTELNKLNSTYISAYALDNLKHKFIADLSIALPWQLYLDGKVSWQDRNGSYLYYASPESIPYEKSYDPFWLINIRTGIKIGRFEWYINIANLLNALYRDTGSVVMPGRWVGTGIKLYPISAS